MTTQGLARRLGFTALIFYGVGDVLGAGIYALVGKVVGLAGPGAWLSFIAAGVVAVLTGLSYAELSSRVPSAAGAAAFVKKAFPGRLIATVTGVFVLGTGLASTATVTSAFSGYLRELLSVPDLAAQIFLLLSLSFLSFWGIQHSSRVNVVFTSVELFGLLAVIAVGLFFLGPLPLGDFWRANLQSFDVEPVLAGITVAFFAYVGFEDLCNLADEAKNPARDIPRAILIAVGSATLIYFLVTFVLQIHFEEAAIGRSETPLLLVFEKAGMDWVPRYFSLVALLAIANTGLANLIMASRLLYGMSREGLLPRTVGLVHDTRRTPWVAVLIAFGIALLLIVTGTVKILAQTTGLLVMFVFILVHASLIRIQRLREKHSGIRIPMAVPIAGALCCFFLLFQFPWEAFARILILLSVALLVWFFSKR